MSVRVACEAGTMLLPVHGGRVFCVGTPVRADHSVVTVSACPPVPDRYRVVGAVLGADRGEIRFVAVVKAAPCGTVNA